MAAVANGGKVYDLRLIDSIISPDGGIERKHPDSGFRKSRAKGQEYSWRRCEKA